MRFLVLLLLCINLAVLAWYGLFAQPNAAPSAAERTAGLPKISLLETQQASGGEVPRLPENYAQWLATGEGEQPVPAEPIVTEAAEAAGGKSPEPAQPAEPKQPETQPADVRPVTPPVTPPAPPPATAPASPAAPAPKEAPTTPEKAPSVIAKLNSQDEADEAIETAALAAQAKTQQQPEPASNATDSPATGSQAAESTVVVAAAETKPVAARAVEPSSTKSEAESSSATAVAAQTAAAKPAAASSNGSSAKPAVPAATEYCYRAEAYQRQIDAEIAVRRLQKLGAVAQSKPETSGELAGKWLIYLLPNATAARALGEKITALGVRDWAIIAAESGGYAVSAGLFATDAGLQDRLRVLAPLSQTPVLRDHYRQVERYTVTARKAGQPLPADRLQGLQELDCKEINKNL